MTFQPSGYGMTYEQAMEAKAYQDRMDDTSAMCASAQSQAEAANAMSYVVMFPAVIVGTLGGALIGGWKGAVVGGGLGWVSKFPARSVFAEKVKSTCSQKKA